MKIPARKLFQYLLFLPLFFACEKSNQPGNNPKAGFPLGTEWSGSMHLTGTPYDQPCCLRINADNTVIIYSMFAFIINNDVVEKDSVKATISNVATSGNVTKVTIDLPGLPNFEPNTILTITGQNTLTYTSSSGGFALNLQKYPDKALPLLGTWTGPVMHGGPLEGRHAYPDLSSIVFYGDSTTQYWRNGELQVGKNPEGDYIPLLSAYIQHGAMVWMRGYNETNFKLIKYFGVMLPDGKTMLVNSRYRLDARLPSSLATIDWNGPKGVTPVIHKE